MTREEINDLLAEAGVENVSKAAITNILNAFNNQIKEVKAQVEKEAVAKNKDLISKEDHQKVVDELNGLKDANAKASRVAKYKEKGLNVEDEDILNLIESKFKTSEKLDEDLDTYVKDHPNFMKQKTEVKEDKATKIEFGATKGGSSEPKDEMSDFDKAFYKLNPQLKK